MNGSFDEWPDSIHDDHESVGGFKSQQVDKEVSGQLPIFCVVDEVAGKGS